MYKLEFLVHFFLYKENYYFQEKNVDVSRTQTGSYMFLDLS